MMKPRTSPKPSCMPLIPKKSDKPSARNPQPSSKGSGRASSFHLYGGALAHGETYRLSAKQGVGWVEDKNLKTLPPDAVVSGSG